MSQSEDYDVQIEIQNLLIKINDDIINLNNELLKINTLVEENAPLPETVKMVNEKLIETAKEAGIDLENINDFARIEDHDQFQEDCGGDVSDDGNILTLNTTAAVTEKITKEIQKNLKK